MDTMQHDVLIVDGLISDHKFGFARKPSRTKRPSLPLVDGPTSVKVPFQNIRDAAVSDTFSVLVDGGGNMWMAGNNGIKDAHAYTKVPPGDLEHEVVKKVAVGATHALALSETGQVCIWGPIAHASPYASGSTPVAIGALAHIRAVDIACGRSHAVVVTTDGDVYIWGSNLMSQIGTTPAATPTKVDFSAVPRLGGARFVAVACGPYYTAVLTHDGRVVAWGDNSGGQLGASTAGPTRAAVVYRPHVVPTPCEVVEIAAGASCLLVRGMDAPGSRSGPVYMIGVPDPHVAQSGFIQPEYARPVRPPLPYAKAVAIYSASPLPFIQCADGSVWATAGHTTLLPVPHAHGARIISGCWGSNAVVVRAPVVAAGVLRAADQATSVWSPPAAADDASAPPVLPDIASLHSISTDVVNRTLAPDAWDRIVRRMRNNVSTRLMRITDPETHTVMFSTVPRSDPVSSPVEPTDELVYDDNDEPLRVPTVTARMDGTPLQQQQWYRQPQQQQTREIGEDARPWCASGFKCESTDPDHHRVYRHPACVANALPAHGPKHDAIDLASWFQYATGHMHEQELTPDVCARIIVPSKTRGREAAFLHWPHGYARNRLDVLFDDTDSGQAVQGRRIGAGAFYTPRIVDLRRVADMGRSEMVPCKFVLHLAMDHPSASCIGTDVLQTMPENAGAMFQVVCNPNALMSASLDTAGDAPGAVSEYPFMPGQGPSAAMGVPAAAIVRAFAPFYRRDVASEEWGQTPQKHVRLIDGAAAKFYTVDPRGGPIDSTGREEAVPVDPIRADINVVDHIRVGVQVDADAVCYRPHELRPFLHVVPAQSRHQISQVLCTSMCTHTDTSGTYRDAMACVGAHNAARKDAQRASAALLRAAYMGAYYAAIVHNCPKLFLTMVGAGAFHTNTQTILDTVYDVHREVCGHRANTISEVHLTVRVPCGNVELVTGLPRFIRRLRDSGMRISVVHHKDGVPTVQL